MKISLSRITFSLVEATLEKNIPNNQKKPNKKQNAAFLPKLFVNKLKVFFKLNMKHYITPWLTVYKKISMKNFKICIFICYK